MDMIKRRRDVIANAPHLETASGKFISFSTDISAPLKECIVSLPIVQQGSGDPSPTNVRPINGYNGVTVDIAHGFTNEIQYPVSWESSAGTIGCGTVDLINGTLTQTHIYIQYVGALGEAWNVENSTNFYIMTPTTWLRNTTGATLACNMALSYTSVGPGTCRITSTGNFNINIGGAIGINTVAGFKEYLASHPLQVVCQLQTPAVYQLTPQVIKVLKGTNQIRTENDTTMSISYWCHINDAAASETIGGIPVFQDNVLWYNTSDKGIKTQGWISDERYFLAGPFSTGTVGSDTHTYTIKAPTRPTSENRCLLRVFSRLDGTSFSTWALWDRTFTTDGQYFIIPLSKADIEYQYLYDNNAGRYVYRGALVPNYNIDGIPVLVDNARYPRQNGTFDDYISDSNYFLTGWFDIGSSESKQYEFSSIGSSNISSTMGARWFDTKTGTSVDYWGANDSSTRTFSAAGRFVVATVYKPTASTFYLYNSTDNKYLFRGKSI